MDPEICEMCQEILGKNAKILTDEETRSVFRQFKQCFPIAEEGRIDCARMDYCKEVDNIHNVPVILSQVLQHYTHLVYVLWYGGDLPIGRVCLQDVLNRFDEVAELCFDVWIFNLEACYVIESHHSFGVRVGTIFCNNYSR